MAAAYRSPDCVLELKQGLKAPLACTGTHMGKVLIQVGASEEARAAVQAGVPSGHTLVLPPRSNVPEAVKPAEEAAPALTEGEADKAESKPEVSQRDLAGSCFLRYRSLALLRMAKQIQRPAHL